MSRYIDADALHEALKAKQKWIVRCGDKHNEGYTYDQVHFAIDDAPTIEPKRGEWIEIKRYWEINQWVYEIECSVCKERIKNPYEPHFCPNCGAKMDGEREGE